MDLVASNKGTIDHFLLVSLLTILLRNAQLTAQWYANVLFLYIIIIVLTLFFFFSLHLE